MTDGYLYCFSNQLIPGILKVGMTERTPEIRLNEANNSDTWRPPIPYEIVFAKKVSNPKQKETTLFSILSQYTERINPRREFFRVSQEEVKTLFDLIDGELWVETPKEKEDEEDEEENEKNKEKGCRDMTKCFTHGQRIRHKIGINKIWIGIYDSSKNGIIYDTKFYKSLSRFVQTHYSIDKPNRITANGWAECECEVNGEWISTFNL
jgi:hypothetical protein